MDYQCLPCQFLRVYVKIQWKHFENWETLFKFWRFTQGARVSYNHQKGHSFKSRFKQALILDPQSLPIFSRLKKKKCHLVYGRLSGHPWRRQWHKVMWHLLGLALCQALCSTDYIPQSSHGLLGGHCFVLSPADKEKDHVPSAPATSRVESLDSTLGQA